MFQVEHYATLNSVSKLHGEFTPQYVTCVVGSINLTAA